jgi:hypothetical protein
MKPATPAPAFLQVAIVAGRFREEHTKKNCKTHLAATIAASGFFGRKKNYR